MRVERDKLEEERDHIQAQRRQIRKELDEARDERDEVCDERDEARDERDQILKERDRLQQQLNQIEAVATADPDTVRRELVEAQAQLETATRERDLARQAALTGKHHIYFLRIMSTYIICSYCSRRSSTGRD